MAENVCNVWKHRVVLFIGNWFGGQGSAFWDGCGIWFL